MQTINQQHFTEAELDQMELNRITEMEICRQAYLDYMGYISSEADDKEAGLPE